MHGANRLASNSLLEAVVFAARIARDIQGLLPSPRVARWSVDRSIGEAELPGGVGPDVIERVRVGMTRDVGVIREASGLKRMLDLLDEIEARVRDVGTINTLTAARLVTAAALARTESRGGHYRSDFPETDPAQARRTFLTLDRARRISAALLAPSEAIRA